MTNQECTTWDCDRPGIAHLTVRRPCGHPVAPGQHEQLQWTCGTHLRERAGQAAPGPSTCPTCHVRGHITTDALVHAAITDWGTAVCRNVGASDQIAVYVRSNRRLTTCPDCIEWLHA